MISGAYWPVSLRGHRRHDLIRGGTLRMRVVNDIAWRTDVPADALDLVPPEWEPAVRGDSIDLSILLQTDPEPMIEATANGHTVTYRPTAEPGCD
jgi:hypothetical protein